MNSSQEVRMTYSGLVNYKGEKAVRVVFERGKTDYAEGIVPSGILESSSGFTEEELERLSDYLKCNADDIFQKAREVNPLRDWIKDSKRR